MKMRKKILICLTALLALAFISTLMVSADNPKYRKGPSVSDNGLTATATGTLTGLGNGNVIVTLSFPDATGGTNCTSPGGGSTAPGQNPALSVPVSDSALITDVKNGNLSFTVTTNTPDNPTPGAAGCPNNNWSAAFSDLNFGCGTCLIQQETFQGSAIYVTVLTNSVCLN